MLLGNCVKRRLEWWRWERGWEKIKLHKFTGRSQNAKERKLKVKKLSLFFLGFWFFRFLNRNFVKFSELLFFAFHVILPLYLVSKDFYATISKFLTLHITCVVHSKECYLVFTKSLIVEIDRFRALKEINFILFGGGSTSQHKIESISLWNFVSILLFQFMCEKIKNPESKPSNLFTPHLTHREIRNARSDFSLQVDSGIPFVFTWAQLWLWRWDFLGFFCWGACQVLERILGTSVGW